MLVGVVVSVFMPKVVNKHAPTHTHTHTETNKQPGRYMCVSVCVCARYVPSRQRMRIPQRVAHVSFAVVVAVVCAGWRLRCLRCFAACAALLPAPMSIPWDWPEPLPTPLRNTWQWVFCVLCFFRTHTHLH